MSKPSSLAALVFFAAASLIALSAPIHAALDVDFGASIRLNDDTDLYFAISSRYFEKDRSAIKTVAAHYRNPDDLAVSLFIAKHSGRSADEIHALRHKGLSWWDISIRFGVPQEVWFVPVKHDPGPPYGKAYGHWKKRHHDKTSVVLSDDDIRNLVAVRVLHDYYAVPVEVAMEWRSSGRDLRVLVTEEYHKRHGKPAKAAAKSQGKGHGKGPKKK